jgi:hypothetical protein
MVVIYPVGTSLQASSACTSDWIREQVKGGVLYSYDLNTLISIRQNGLTQTQRTHLNETKKMYHSALEQLSRL